MCDGSAFALQPAWMTITPQRVAATQRWHGNNMGEMHLRQETDAKTVNGWIALLLVSTLLCFGASFLLGALPHFEARLLLTGLALLGVGVFCVRGFFTLQPNEAAVTMFFGNYAGTARNSGFHWVNPFYVRRRLSLRVHNLTTPILKVNDERGHPIEIGAVIVWRVNDTARAIFEVEDYGEYIRIQCESAVREVAGRYAYDINEEMLVPARYKTLRATSTRSARSCDRPFRATSMSPASPWRKPRSRIYRMHPRSLNRCCAVNRPRPSSVHAASWSKARSAWWRWPCSTSARRA